MANCLLLKTKPDKFLRRSEFEENSDDEEAMLCFMSIKENTDEVERNNTL